MHALCEFDPSAKKLSTEDAATETPTTEGVSNLVVKIAQSYQYNIFFQNLSSLNL